MNPHGGQNWGGFALVLGLLALGFVFYLDAMRAARRADRHQKLVDDAAQAGVETRADTEARR